MMFGSSTAKSHPAVASSGPFGYAAHGIKKDSGSYDYDGKRIKVIKDQGPNGSVYSFDPKRKGKISIKIVRNATGEIERISYLSKKETARLIKRAGLKT